MSNYLKIPSPWSQLGLFLGLTGGSLVLASIAILLLPGVHQGQMPTDSGTLKLVQTVTSVILFGVPSFFYARMTFRDHPLAHLGFRPAVKSNYYLLVTVLLFCAFPLEGWLGMINQHAHLPAWMVKSEDDIDRQVAAILQVHHSWDLLVNLLVVAILPAIFEEMCFRGALQRILIHIFKSPWAGIIVTAILFSSFHMQFAGFLPRMFLGVLLGAAYWYSGSLWTTILAHGFFNGIQVVLATLYPKMVTGNPSVPLYLALISLVIVVGLLAYMRKESTVTYAQVYHTGKMDEFDEFMSART